MDKKTLFLIIFIFIVVIIGLIFGIITFYRFFLIQNINGKLYENIEKDNYYLKTEVKSYDGNVSVTEAYYRDGVGKLVAENGVYTWADGEYAYMIDEANKKAYVLDIKNENLGLVSYNMFATVIPSFNKSFFERLFIAGNLKNTIKKTKENGSVYYIIKVSDENVTREIWLNEKATPIKGQLLFEDGKIINYEYNIKFNEVKLKDIELPRVDDYTVIDTETNEVVLDNVSK